MFDSHQSFHQSEGAQMLLWCCLAHLKGQKGAQLMELYYSVNCFIYKDNLRAAPAKIIPGKEGFQWNCSLYDYYYYYYYY